MDRYLPFTHAGSVYRIADPNATRPYYGNSGAAVIPLIVHRRLIDTLAAHKISGWQTYRVDVAGRDGDRMPDYHGLAVTGRCEIVTCDRKQISERGLPILGNEQAKGGRFMLEEYWDGADFFMESEAGRVSKGFKYVTGRVVELCQSLGMKNIKFEELASSLLELVF